MIGHLPRLQLQCAKNKIKLSLNSIIKVQDFRKFWEFRGVSGDPGDPGGLGGWRGWRGPGGREGPEGDESQEGQEGQEGPIDSGGLGSPLNLVGSSAGHKEADLKGIKQRFLFSAFEVWKVREVWKVMKGPVDSGGLGSPGQAQGGLKGVMSYVGLGI